MRYVSCLSIGMSLFIMVFIGFTPAWAADATVTDCTNFTGAGTISDAVATANSGGGTITFVCSGTIIFANQLDITANVVINSNGNTVIFDESGDDNRFFAVIIGASLELNGLTLQNGNSNVSGAIENLGVLTINNSTFDNNISLNNSGAIYNAPPATLTITNSIFTNNMSQFGGVIFNDGIMTITNSTFADNSAAINGGAIHNDGTTTITNSTFTNNLSPDAGAIYNSFTVLTITNSTFTGNTGNALVNFATLDLINSTFRNNSSDAFENRSGGTTITRDSHYEDNTCNSANIGTLTDNGGNTVINASNCPGAAPIALGVSALACNGDNAEFTINTGDANFNITGAGVGLDILDSPVGLITLTGPATWTDVTITERRGEREFVNLGGISCPEAVIVPPSVPATPAVTVLGCALDSTDGVDVANAPDNTYCRVLMKNGGVVSYSGAVPADLIQLGVILAVDVYRLEGGATINTFPDYARICLQGSGRYFYMDGRNAPRVAIEMPTESLDGLTCAWIPAPGTVILTN